MSRRIEDLSEEMQEHARDFLAAAEASGFSVLITQTKRTPAEQDALYEQGRTRPGKIVTNAQAGETPHCPPGDVPALAFDIAFREEGTGWITWDEPHPGGWEEIGVIGESAGLEWGGRWTKFQDRPHFQMRHWRDHIQEA